MTFKLALKENIELKKKLIKIENEVKKAIQIITDTLKKRVKS